MGDAIRTEGLTKYYGRHRGVAGLDLAAVARAEGDAREAARIARDQICNRSDDGGPPMELPDRTREIRRSSAVLTSPSPNNGRIMRWRRCCERIRWCAAFRKSMLRERP